jgi:hypothetical protein
VNLFTKSRERTQAGEIGNLAVSSPRSDGDVGEAARRVGGCSFRLPATGTPLRWQTSDMPGEVVRVGRELCGQLTDPGGDLGQLTVVLAILQSSGDES